MLLRIGDVLLGLHLDSRYIILESVGTTFAGKCLRNRDSHCGQDCAAADAGAGMDNAVMRAIAMILLINLFNFCN